MIGVQFASRRNIRKEDIDELKASYQILDDNRESNNEMHKNRISFE